MGEGRKICNVAKVREEGGKDNVARVWERGDKGNISGGMRVTGDIIGTERLKSDEGRKGMLQVAEREKKRQHQRQRERENRACGKRTERDT